MKASTLLVTVIGAAAAGVVVGLMIAPDKGSETRRMLAEKAEDWKNKAGDLIKTGKEYVNDVASSLKSNGQKMEKEVENQFNRASTDLG